MSERVVDGAGPSKTPSRLAIAARAPLAALTLLTVLPLPVGLQRRIGAREVAASAGWFPIVGALLGVIVGGAATLVSSGGSAVLAGALAVVLLAGLTGALHLDGLADCADALGARGGQPERRLEIMRDPATGVYGTAAIVGWFALIAAALATIPTPQLLPAILWALVLGRTAAVRHARILPSARAAGLGAGFTVSRAGTAVAVVLALAIGLGLAAASSADPGFATFSSWEGITFPPPATILWMAAAAIAASALVTRAAARLVGGRTGDTLGATVALVEAAALVAAALLA